MDVQTALVVEIPLCFADGSQVMLFGILDTRSTLVLDAPLEHLCLPPGVSAESSVFGCRIVSP